MTVQQPAEWNASIYHQVSNPHVLWGRTVLSDLSLRGDETAIDAGCGSGRLTAELLELLPEGRVIAIDRSANMVMEARENLARFGDRVHVVQADVGHLTPAEVGEPVDLIFSTATFHWIRDHHALFRGLFSVLKPGGLLSAQCGGGPNLESLLARAEEQMRSPELARLLRWLERSLGVRRRCNDRQPAPGCRIHQHHHLALRSADPDEQCRGV